MQPSLLRTRRAALRSIVGGSLTLPGIVAQLLAADAGRKAAGLGGADPLAPKKSHHEPKAKRVIFLFSSGGVSHMDTFDYKPELFKADGKKTGVGGGLSLEQRPLLKPRWDFKPGGTCGTLVSDLFPHLRAQMDDICLIRSMTTDNNEHFQATLAIHTGSFFFARPSLGSWISYGLGTFNQNLPSFVVIAPYLPYAGGQVWANDFLPAYHQGTRVLPGKEPIPNVNRQSATAALQEMELGLANAFNRQHLKSNGNDSELAARLKTFETAFQMQFEAPEAFDLSKESDETLRLYGMQRGQNDGFAWQCLVARRLAERGVRFIELIDVGSANNWDSHADMAAHEPLARKIDRPIAGLIQDLKRRGMLDDTLVVWTSEFGRTPGIDGPKGRGHHPGVYSSWLAGGGIKGGLAYGESDEIGATVGRNKVHVHDFHATILHLLGLDHEKLTYRHAGRDFRLTDVHGNVVRDILA
ncbi:hypothetical protein AYO44_00710 [Planctomycetaceae bacterium SCGC AG-212-F19]|nr:hypothetical protein AYO44_00710 [Planctomycetaceae bacterium SCGC AG-212-F19]